MSTSNKTQGPFRVGGQPLLWNDVVSLARLQREVVLDESALSKVQLAFDALVALVENGDPVYGVTRGVGQNVDIELIPNQHHQDWDSLRQQSRKANESLIYSHSAAIGEYLKAEEVRAALIVRLNGLMHGHTGCRPEICQQLLQLLQTDELPSIRRLGSVGQADIVQASEFGNSLLKDDSKPPECRDALSLVSTNAISMGVACLLLHDIERCLGLAERVFLCSLNGMNGNIGPLHHHAADYQAQPLSERRLQFYEQALQGSYLHAPDTNRKLQDPLSYRCSPQVFELASQTLLRAKTSINQFLGSVEDNPLVLFDEKVSASQDSKKVTADSLGKVVPNANFCPLSVVLELSSLATMLGHTGVLSAQRTQRLTEKEHTGLNRFLAYGGSPFGFCALQKVPVSLVAELRKESSLDLFDLASMAGGIEDFSTHLPVLLRSLTNQVRLLYELLSIELLHACQAMSIRQLEAPQLSFGEDVDKVLQLVQQVCPIYQDDRPLTQDLQRIREIVDKLSCEETLFQDAESGLA